ncbi:MAG: 5-formyltetrahydrofolate cyclo-ligase [Rhodospirillaceae bacterium]
MKHPSDIVQWRIHQRADMLARRAAISAEDRSAWNQAITRFLIDGFPCLEGMVVGFCWPFKGEFDARHAMRHFRERGAVTALPVVLRKEATLEFRVWTPDIPTVPGVFGLPVPQGTPAVRPDALLIPPIGFGAQGYRLGYGGGYFDRTLAEMSPQPLKIGVAFEICRMPTIYPQPHDVPMDFIVTERGIHEVSASGLALIEDIRQVRRTIGSLSRERTRAHIRGKRESLPQGVEYMAHNELASLLNTLLEAERAGAKVISAYMTAYEAGSLVWMRLNTVQRDEAMNCAVLMSLIRGLGAAPTDATGGFLHKALAVRGYDERLAFLNRGQNWVVRTIRNALPRIGDPIVKSALKRMLVSHVMNIDRCTRLISRK